MARKKRVTRLQFFLHWLFRVLVFPYVKLVYGFKRKSIYRIKKGEKLLILSNHQTDIDPLCIATCFRGRVYIVGTDTLFSGKHMGKFLDQTYGVIPKKKGSMDSRCTKLILQTVKEGGSVLLFPEGNRTYAEFQFYISQSIVKLVRKLGCTIVIYNMHGGTGISPRFSSKKRKGSFYGEIKRFIPYEEYEKMSDDELYDAIKDGIRVFDSESGLEYDSKNRAEYLERMFFVCPKCMNTSSLTSSGNYLTCTNCSLKVEYTKDMHLKSDDESFKFERMLDWWNFDKKYIRDLVIEDDSTIFEDEVTLFLSNPYEGRKRVYEGLFSINKNSLVFGDTVFSLKDIRSASVISGKKIGMVVNEDNYLIVGNDRFNPLKYVFLFNKLDTYMKENDTDKYFTLEDD